jgi:alkanesulfonate monooxygenase SsuD/methylene tetrahydromethanopterin reductase-like flavin-dependent oxidoreductase (luciferase family)
MAAERAVGIGRAAQPTESPRRWLSSVRPKERIARFKEYVEVVDCLLSSEVTTYSGKFYEVSGAAMAPWPPAATALLFRERRAVLDLETLRPHGKLSFIL